MKRRAQLTTLETARLLANAVLLAGRTRHRDATKDAPTQAILEAMDKLRIAFLTYDLDEDGVAAAESYRRLIR